MYRSVKFGRAYLHYFIRQLLVDMCLYFSSELWTDNPLAMTRQLALQQSKPTLYQLPCEHFGGEGCAQGSKATGSVLSALHDPTQGEVILPPLCHTRLLAMVYICNLKVLVSKVSKVFELQIVCLLRTSSVLWRKAAAPREKASTCRTLHTRLIFQISLCRV